MIYFVCISCLNNLLICHSLFSSPDSINFSALTKQTMYEQWKKTKQNLIKEVFKSSSDTINNKKRLSQLTVLSLCANINMFWLHSMIHAHRNRLYAMNIHSHDNKTLLNEHYIIISTHHNDLIITPHQCYHVYQCNSYQWKESSAHMKEGSL